MAVRESDLRAIAAAPGLFPFSHATTFPIAEPVLYFRYRAVQGAIAGPAPNCPGPQENLLNPDFRLTAMNKRASPHIR